VPLVEERSHGRQALDRAETPKEVLPIGSGRLADEELLMALPRLLEASAGAGEPRLGQKLIVLQEAKEDRREDPMSRDLGQPLIEPGAIALPRPTLLPCPLVFGPERSFEVRMMREAVAEVGFEGANEPLGGGEEARDGAAAISCSYALVFAICYRTIA
jgi:hypothetical protein